MPEVASIAQQIVYWYCWRESSPSPQGIDPPSRTEYDAVQIHYNEKDGRQVACTYYNNDLVVVDVVEPQRPVALEGFVLPSDPVDPSDEISKLPGLWISQCLISLLRVQILVPGSRAVSPSARKRAVDPVVGA